MPTAGALLGALSVAAASALGCVQLLGVDGLFLREEPSGDVRDGESADADAYDATSVEPARDVGGRDDAGAYRVSPMISAGGYHTCLLASDGGVRCTGNDYGSIVKAKAPTSIAGLDEPATFIADSDTHVCVRTRSARVKCWGENAAGQLGNGTNVASATPVDVGLVGVAGVTAGSKHTCALLEDRTVRCWGAQHYVGVTVAEDAKQPVRVTTLENVTALVSGHFHACAISGGTVACWGDNSKGQLGNALAGLADEPLPVTGLPGPATALFAFGWSTCANVGSDVYCWGRRDKETASPTPRRLEALTTGVRAMVGSLHTCAITNPGRVLCWGDDRAGQTGTPDASAEFPFDVSKWPSATSSVAAGYVHTCALTELDGVWCWGSNSDHQFGPNSACTTCREPVNIGF